jgi:hypothetical protein
MQCLHLLDLSRRRFVKWTLKADILCTNVLRGDVLPGRHFFEEACFVCAPMKLYLVT